MSNIIDKIQVSGVTYDIGGSGGGGNPTVELTQAEYDALVTAGTVSADTYYIITDAEAGDLTNYYTKSETNTLLAGKQATLVSGTNIKTINNESILGSGNIDIQGGSTYTAGRGISITNDTISFSLPISAGTGTNSIVFGNATTAQTNGTNAFGGGKSGSAHYVVSFGQNSFSYGEGTQAYKNNSQSFGNETESRNISEHSIGQFNVSNSATTTFGNSGNTLFSVGNGTANNARHNAFEIRQNGDIYLSSGGTDIKLQDHLGGGGSSINVVQTTGSSTTDVMSQDAVSTQLNNKANKSAAVGGYHFGSSSDGDYIQYKNVNNSDIGNSIYYPKINGKYILTSNSIYAKNNYNFQLVETSAITTSMSSSSTDSQLPSAKAVYDQFGGLKLVKLTQSEYDALATKDNSTLYVIVN